MVHVEVIINNNRSWFLTIVYGSTHYSQRRTLWDEIQELHAEVHGDWCLIGDFNSTLKDCESTDPPLANSHTVESGFQRTIDRYNLLDMDFSGDPFTWVRGNTRKRFDRALSNLDWRLRFSDRGIMHLPKLKSDHAPLLMAFDNRRNMNRRRRRRRPFRFEAIWLTHPSFNQLSQDNWKAEMTNVPTHLKELQGILRKWNHDVFGNIFTQKKALIKKLKNVDRRLQHIWNDHLLNIQKNTWKEYDHIQKNT